jgi:hypothetical protein
MDVVLRKLSTTVHSPMNITFGKAVNDRTENYNATHRGGG